MASRIRFLAIVLAAAALASGYMLKGGFAAATDGGAAAVYGVGAVLALALGIIWLVGTWRRWLWAPTAGLVLGAGLAGYGLLQHAGAGWMLVGLVAALTAWDLDRFVQILSAVERIENRASLERRHLQRLVLVDGLGLLLGAVALLVRTRISLALMLLLGLVIVMGLYRAMSYLGRESG
jgi:hypothetical protein